MPQIVRFLWHRLRSLFSAQSTDQDFEAELDDHLSMLVEEYIRRGASPGEAARAARLQMGNLTRIRETHSEMGRVPDAAKLFHDVRFACRVLSRKPGFAIICIATLGLGIGASTSIFTVIDRVLLRPLPYPNSGRLVRIQESHAAGTASDFTYATYLDIETNAKSLADISAFRPWKFSLVGDGDPEEVVGALVSGNFFSALGTKPSSGRLIGRRDDQQGGDNKVIVIGNSLWRRRFASDPRIIGRVVQVNSEPYQVVGVMPRGFDYPNKAELWCPLLERGEMHGNRRAHLLTVIGDLRVGENDENVRSEMSVLADRINKLNPGVDPGMSFSVASLKKVMIAPVQPALLVLTSAVALLLLMACANVANLLFTRFASRRKEFAVRMAIGAGRLRLARQLVTECLVIALGGSLLGLAIATCSLRFMVRENVADIPRFAELSIDKNVLAFALMLAIFTAILFGLAPILVEIRTDLNTSLKEHARCSGRRKGSSRILVSLQFAMAVVLMAGAVLVGSSFMNLLRVDPGFSANRVITVSLFLSPLEYPEGDPKGPVLLHQIMEKIRRIPGVQSAGVVNSLPLTGGPATDFSIGGQPAPPPNDEPSADIRTADSDYFRTMGIPLLAGREFSGADRADSARVIVINQTMAHRYWAGGNPIGKRVTMKDWGPPLTGEIVGVVGDVKPAGMDSPVGPMIYWPYDQFPQLFNSLVIRSQEDPKRLIPDLKAAVWSTDKNQPISKIQMMDDVLAESVGRARLYFSLLIWFSCVAFLIAIAGIYGMMSYFVSETQQDMGIRLAVGAQPRDLLLQVLGHGARVALIGTGVGIAAAMILTRLISSLLFGVKPTDPGAFVAVAAVLVFFALLASYIPARRAARVDPLITLRSE
jgi:predicted permease